MIVRTESSTAYIFEEGRVQRARGPHSGPLRRDEEWLNLHNTPDIEVGRPMVMILSGLSTNPNIITIRTTSPVVSIEND